MSKTIDDFMPHVGSVFSENIEITRFNEESPTLYVSAKVKGASISSTFIPETEELSNVVLELYDVEEDQVEKVSEELQNILYDEALTYIKEYLYKDVTEEPAS